ncbi:hypothetical protein [Cellulophaga tyrosinoxydans]|uniref:Lipoprotein n=1 Tax=Cellulophaga tyrosinoxydans TaxID=504486 RepID=A0A1W1Z374_9FLAO|nr:hypothetical protein [Cellulophaga tyrosinoxydans]SMC42834.1 hypothetical protein SAMN05660703_1089 [Cellulophaga tyrosinoxydans]
MKTNHYFKLATLILLFIFIGCQKENIFSIDEKEYFNNQGTGIQVESISNDTIENYLSKSNILTVLNITEKTDSNKKASIKDKNGNNIVYELDYENAVQTINGEYKTITIPISEIGVASNGRFENLILEHQKDTIKRSYINSYLVEKIHKNTHGGSFFMDGLVFSREIYNIDELLSNSLTKNGETCISYKIYNCDWGDKGTHPAGSSCHAEGHAYAVTRTFCYSLFDGGENSGGFISNPFWGSGAGGQNILTSDTSGASSSTSFVMTPSLPKNFTTSLDYITEHIDLTRDQHNWLTEALEEDPVLGFQLSNFITQNNTPEGREFANETINVLKNGTLKEKTLAKALLNNNINLAINILLDGASYNNAQCFPDCGGDMVFDAPVDLTASIFIGALDGYYNLFLTTSIFYNYFEDGKKQQGQLIASILKKSGISIPDDIDHSILSEMFKIRSRNLELIIEPANQDFLDTLGDLSISLLDVMSLVSPGSSSSAYLFAKTGGNITIKAVADYLKIISVTSSKVDGIINSLSSTAKYSLDGTGTFRNVGGHHPLAKIAFELDKFYNFRNAFSVSANKLQEVWKSANPNKIAPIVHDKITGYQISLYKEFGRTGERLSLEKMAEIEIEAMVRAGIPKVIAEGWVIKALQDLKTQDVKLIPHIPWVGKN